METSHWTWLWTVTLIHRDNACLTELRNNRLLYCFWQNNTHNCVLNRFKLTALLCKWSPHSLPLLYLRVYIQGDQKVPVHLIITVKKTQCFGTVPTQLVIWRWSSQNTFGMRTVLYWTRSSRTVRRVNKCLETGGGDFEHQPLETVRPIYRTGTPKPHFIYFFNKLTYKFF
jgi:hypothetical protein